MVRLEKNLYELVLNRPIFGRGRSVASPSKWNYIDPFQYMSLKAYQAAYKVNPLQRFVILPMMDMLMPFLWWGWERDLMKKRGYIPEDFEIYEESDLRRGVFLEHVFRESCHPLHWRMFCFRRLRYYKIDRSTAGFYVPEFVKKETEKSTWADALIKKTKWDRFVQNNFYSDLTPATYYTRSKFDIFEWLQLFGFWRPEAWERYFFNEEKYRICDPADIEELTQKPFNIDIETDHGKRLFENEVNQMIKKYPGLIVPEGEKFDFRAFFAA